MACILCALHKQTTPLFDVKYTICINRFLNEYRGAANVFVMH